MSQTFFELPQQQAAATIFEKTIRFLNTFFFLLAFPFLFNPGKPILTAAT